MSILISLLINDVLTVYDGSRSDLGNALEGGLEFYLEHTRRLPKLGQERASTLGIVTEDLGPFISARSTAERSQYSLSFPILSF